MYILHIRYPIYSAPIFSLCSCWNFHPILRNSLLRRDTSSSLDSPSTRFLCHFSNRALFFGGIDCGFISRPYHLLSYRIFVYKGFFHHDATCTCYFGDQSLPSSSLTILHLILEVFGAIFFFRSSSGFLSPSTMFVFLVIRFCYRYFNWIAQVNTKLDVTFSNVTQHYHLTSTPLSAPLFTHPSQYYTHQRKQCLDLTLTSDGYMSMIQPV